MLGPRKLPLGVLNTQGLLHRQKVKNMMGGWLDSLGSEILVGKSYFGVLQKI